MPGPNSAMVSTRFLIISDTHNFEFEDDTANPLPFRLPVPKVDVLLHCGDLTRCGGSSSYKKAVKMMGAVDAELKLVIAGNHDLDLDKPYWNSHLDEDDRPDDHLRAIEAVTGQLAAEAGVTYLEEGMYTFTLQNGAMLRVYASPYSPAFCDWAFAYERSHDIFNEAHQVVDGVKPIAKHPILSFPHVDVVMTHGPPKGILDKCPGGSVGCNNLLHALGRARPRMHCFGHIHESNGAEVIDWESRESEVSGSSARSQETHRELGDIRNAYPEPVRLSLFHGQQSLMINAAIMDGRNEPKNAPWLVDLELSQA